jgi:hypothetical protein
MNKEKFANIDPEVLKDSKEGFQEVEEYLAQMEIEAIWDHMYTHIAYGRYLQQRMLKLMRYEGIPDNEVRQLEQEINQLVDLELKKKKFTHEF